MTATFGYRRNTRLGLRLVAIGFCATIGLAACAPAKSGAPTPAASTPGAPTPGATSVPRESAELVPSPGQETFATPGQAGAALIAATRANDRQRLLAIFGADGARLIDSGDPVSDREARNRFVAAYDIDHRIESANHGRATLVVGTQQWPFPIPLIRATAGWFFDTDAGEQEILDRRIGRNERRVIDVCRAFVEAENEYADRHPSGFGHREYAQHFMSRPGTRDGLYWPVSVGEPESPLGPLMAEARAEGYTTGKGKAYHGYFYKILKAQGPNAPGGARNYIQDGRMTAGFALVAFPARYGDSGVMTFIVNQDGIVYQKDLGPDTGTVARAMIRFDPDASWKIVP